MRKPIRPLLVLVLSVAPAAAAEQPFSAVFEDATLRIDYYHTGNAEEESIAVDRLIRQGVWAGPRSGLADPSAIGTYFFEARDAATGELVFSKGYDSYFAEYRTTDRAAEGILRTYHESVLLPFPRRPLVVSISARKRDGSFTTINEFAVDPSDLEIAEEPPAGPALVIQAHQGGSPSSALDIAILGEGYTSSEDDVFRADLERATTWLLAQEPFASRRSRISVRGVLATSEQSGCDEPTRGSYRSTALGATFNALGSERYLLSEDNRRIRDVAANVPYDALVIMVNHDRYGGGGIYNLFCTFTAHSPWAEYLLLHEFGHSFAGLADEYYSSSVAYNDFYPRGHEPVEPNITALLDPDQLKWRDLVSPGTALPTPWDKGAYDREDTAYQQERKELNEAIAAAVRSGKPEADVAQLRRDEEEHAAAHSRWAQEFLASEPSAGEVGAFEGAGYSSTGLYRPMLDCLMFSRRVQPYCEVCERAVARTIELLTGPSESPTP